MLFWNAIFSSFETTYIEPFIQKRHIILCLLRKSSRIFLKLLNSNKFFVHFFFFNKKASKLCRKTSIAILLPRFVTLIAAKRKSFKCRGSLNITLLCMQISNQCNLNAAISTCFKLRLCFVAVIWSTVRPTSRVAQCDWLKSRDNQSRVILTVCEIEVIPNRTSK